MWVGCAPGKEAGQRGCGWERCDRSVMCVRKVFVKGIW